MQRSGMWGLGKGRANGVLKERSNNIYCILYCSFRTSLIVPFLTPHSALLHVGLKSLAPSGHLHNISYQ
ncbi:hypothetical protein Barb7_01738 [Bacteroidales bacterium Barb7]|nr:hypothetical protein Barb7_01738 [Bacteroidales bacterium Barb7]